METAKLLGGVRRSAPIAGPTIVIVSACDFAVLTLAGDGEVVKARPANEAASAATTNPARVTGLFRDVGALAFICTPFVSESRRRFACSFPSASPNHNTEAHRCRDSGSVVFVPRRPKELRGSGSIEAHELPWLRAAAG